MTSSQRKDVADRWPATAYKAFSAYAKAEKMSRKGSDP
jgi:hypothetical protein